MQYFSGIDLNTLLILVLRWILVFRWILVQSSNCLPLFVCSFHLHVCTASSFSMKRIFELSGYSSCIRKPQELEKYLGTLTGKNRKCENICEKSTGYVKNNLLFYNINSRDFTGICREETGYLKNGYPRNKM